MPNDWRDENRIVVESHKTKLKIGNQYFTVAEDDDFDDLERRQFLEGMAMMLKAALDRNDAAVLRKAAKDLQTFSTSAWHEAGVYLNRLADELDPKGGSDE